MADQTTRLSDSTERVAYDLMLHIAAGEKVATKDRGYWLTLFSQCVAVAHKTSAHYVMSDQFVKGSK